MQSNMPLPLIKDRPEDFVVEELPLYEPSGTGDHTYFWIEKRGLTTHAAARQLALALGQNPADVGLAGLKDAQALTRQWLSLEHVAQAEERLRELELGPGLRVLQVKRHGNKLRMGHLRGNRFLIRLRDPLAASTSPPVQDAPGAQAARMALREMVRRGIPNYYGEQRFGRDAGNAALGKCLVQGQEAAFCDGLKAQGQSPGRLRDRKFRNLMVNAFQAELFNQVLARRMPELGQLLPGDLACLHRNGAVFHVPDAAAALHEQPRCDAGELSPSGPLYGPKMPNPTGRPGALEAEVLAESGVSAADFGRREAERQPGARRPLRVFFLEEPGVEVEAEGTLLRFALPPGAYATVVLRELISETPT